MGTATMTMLPSMSPNQTIQDYFISPEEGFSKVWSQSEKIPNVDL